MEQEFKDRINLNTDLSTISRVICNEYDLGEYISNTIITVGYEDFNYILETTTGKYFIKKEQIKIVKIILTELN